jgi:hypothetical protein
MYRSKSFFAATATPRSTRCGTSGAASCLLPTDRPRPRDRWPE